ncbi:hypothetical protein FDZ71_05675, partial [bacterium]
MRARVAWLAALILALLAQTALIPPFVTEPWRPDFTRSIVLWLALTGVPTGGVYLSFASGLLVDVASGGPLGFTAVARLVVYALSRPWRGVFDLTGILFIAGPLAVLADTILVFLFKNAVFVKPPSAGVILSIGLRQAAGEIFAVPFAFL